MTPTLVILGGADGSTSTFRRARELGYRTICVDRRGDAVARPLADEFVQASIRDPQLIAAELDGRTDIAGVLSPASDTGLPAQRWLAQLWRLPDPVAATAVLASQDKSHFRAVCDRLGFPGYGYVAGSADGDLVLRAAALRFPVLVKPLDAQSSRGIQVCADVSDVAAAAREAARYASAGEVIVEEQLAGNHYSAEAFVDAGRIAFVGVSARTLTPAPHFVTTAHRVPADLAAAQQHALIGLLDELVAELGYLRGPLTIDLLIDPAGRLHLIEMGARVGGNGLGELVRHAYGVDTVAASIAAATGGAADMVPTRSRAAVSEVLYTDEAGVVADVVGADAAATVPELVELILFARRGQAVLPYHNAANKLGHFVVVADSPDRAAAAAAAVRATLRFELSGAA
ncbi:ATP-grasp domain-containing protein [Nocardia sp. NPDC049149]|uniref:ATP-grasp domain-containing protein n=1 Tax=Nocardia sp. NPDC049149 TaxID=3364315 RepID=UPI003716F4FB